MKSLFVDDHVEPILDKLPKPFAVSAVLAWLGTVLALSGGLLISFNLHEAMVGWLISTLASLSLLVWSLKERLASQVLLHGAYLCINLNGVMNYLL